MSRALIVGDVQHGITHSFEFGTAVLEPITNLLAEARRDGKLVVFVRAAMRESRVDLSDRNMVMGSFFDAGDLFHERSENTQVDARLAPLPDEPVVTKRRVSAFHGTELDLILRSQEVHSLTIVGVATSAVVLATMLDAIDLDYDVTVVREGCADPDPEVHRFMLDRVFPDRGAKVVSIGN